MHTPKTHLKANDILLAYFEDLTSITTQTKAKRESLRRAREACKHIMTRREFECLFADTTKNVGAALRTLDAPTGQKSQVPRGMISIAQLANMTPDTPVQTPIHTPSLTRDEITRATRLVRTTIRQGYEQYQETRKANNSQLMQAVEHMCDGGKMIVLVYEHTTNPPYMISLLSQTIRIHETRLENHVLYGISLRTWKTYCKQATDTNTILATTQERAAEALG